MAQTPSMSLVASKLSLSPGTPIDQSALIGEYPESPIVTSFLQTRTQKQSAVGRQTSIPSRFIPKRLNTACHFCDHAAQRSGRRAVALQIACSSPKCRKVYCSRRACMLKLRRSVTIESLAEFRVFKAKLEQEEAVFVCPHCRDESICNGPQCNRRWLAKKNRSKEIAEDCKARKRRRSSVSSIDSTISSSSVLSISSENQYMSPSSSSDGSRLNNHSVIMASIFHRPGGCHSNPVCNSHPMSDLPAPFVAANPVSPIIANENPAEILFQMRRESLCLSSESGSKRSDSHSGFRFAVPIPQRPKHAHKVTRFLERSVNQISIKDSPAPVLRKRI